VAIPVIANGEIWTPDDARRCRSVSGCDGLMLGRGMVVDPGLALAIRAQRRAGGAPRSFDAPAHAIATARDASGDVRASAGGPHSPAAYGVAPALAWDDLLPLIADFWHRVSTRVEPRHRAGRLKQWLNLLRRRYPQAQRAYDELRLVNDPAALAVAMFANVRPTLHGLVTS
jgi:tRNA-dihydrouridine synthase C